MSSQSTAYAHEALALAIEAFGKLDEVVESPERLERFTWRIERWRQGIYNLVVVGEVKKGKSSFINALLGMPGLSPVADRIASAVPLRISYGTQLRFTVHWLPNDDGVNNTPREISPKDLPLYATETGVDSRVGGISVTRALDDPVVSHIAVEAPHALLEDGLCLVDLPGLGGVFRHHTRLVWEYLEPQRVDHVCFILDSTGNPLDDAEAEFLRKLRGRKLDNFLFVQTKSDAADPEKIAQWQAGNSEAISQILEVPSDELEYFTVSNRLEETWLHTGDPQDHIDSGFAALGRYLRDTLMREKKDRLAEPILQDLAEEVGDIQAHLTEMMRIYEQASRLEREAAVNRHRAEMNDYDSWQKLDFADIQRELEKGLRDAKTQGIDRLEDELGLSVSTASYRELDKIGSSEKSVLSMLDDAKEVCINKSITAHESIEADYLETVASVFDRAATRMKQSLNSPKIQHRNPSMTDIVVVSHHAKNRIMESVTRVMPGVAVGTVVGSAIGGAVAGSAGGPIGAVIGAIVVTWKVLSEAKERNREAALAKAKGVLDHACIQAQRRAQRAFRDLCVQAETEIPGQLGAFVKLRKEQLSQKAVGAERALRSTDDEIRQEKLRLEGRRDAAKRVEDLIRASAGLA